MLLLGYKVKNDIQFYDIQNKKKSITLIAQSGS